MDRQAVAAIAALDEQVRGALYDFVRAQSQPVTREQAASALGISRKLAAFHLEKLVAVGLLTATIDSVSPRRVGRAPKVYQPAEEHVEMHLPPRSPGLLAEILVDAAIAESSDAAVLNAARNRGTAVGAHRRERERPGRLGAERALGIMCRVLSEHGFEAVRDGSSVTLRNCAFHPLAAAEPRLVCGLNHAFVTGVLDGLDASGVRADLAPGPGRCCVVLQSGRSAAD